MKISDCIIIKINRTKSGNTIDINDLPSAPITSPAAPNTGDTIIENYDNGQVYWTWNGTAWVLDFAVTTTDIHHTHYDNSANALDETVLPTAPANPPTGIQDEHTLHELYSNGQIFWTWNGTNWVRDYIITDCCHTQDNQLANTLDCTTLPTAPLNPPANATTNDTLHERYVNGSMYWLYNGTAWIYEFHICDGDVYHTHSDQTANTLDANALPIVPVAPPTNIEAEHTLHELYANGEAFWTYDGTNWVLDYTIIGNCCTSFNTGVNFDCGNEPTTPTNAPATPDASDTLIEIYDNSVIYWHYDGTNWIQDSIVYNTEHFQQINATAIDTDALPALPNGITDATGYVNGDTIFEQFTNGYILWNVVGCAWVRQNVQTFTTGNATTVTSNVDFDCANVPTTPPTLPAGATNGDTLIDIYTNASDQLRVVQTWAFDGTNWVQTEIAYNAMSFTVVTGTAIDTGNLPTTPVTPGATTDYVDGDTLWEQFTNGYIIWTYTGCVWVQTTVQTFSTGNSTTVTSNVDFDCANIPTTPPNAPATPTNGDTLIDIYADANDSLRVIQSWSFDGTNWVQTEIVYNPTHTYVATGTNLDAAALPTTPVTPGATTDHVNGDSLREEFNNGYILWTYTGCAWVLTHSEIITDCCTTINAEVGYDCAAPPTTPANAPANPATGDTLIETYGQATIYWVYDGTNWVEESTEFHNIHEQVVTGTAIDTGALPTTPVTPGTTTDHVNGDTLWEEFTNGYILWTYTGCAWVRTTVRTFSTGSVTTINSEDDFDCANIPTAPQNAPAGPSNGDVLVEIYTDANDDLRVIQSWSFDGTNWVQTEIVYNPTHFDVVTGTAIDTGNLPATPVTPGLTTQYVNGDTLREEFTNGYIVWTYTACAWVRTFVRTFSTGNSTTVNSETDFDCTTVPTAPANPPATPVSGDTLIEIYSNADDQQRVIQTWAFDGTNWVQTDLTYNTMSFDVVIAADLDAANLPTAPVTPGATTDYVNGDTLREEFNNGYILWTYTACAWVLTYSNVTADCCTTIAAEANYDCANPPTVPVNPPLTPATGDVHIEFYSNGTRANAVTIRWEYDGTNWIVIDDQFFLDEFEHDLAGTDIDFDNLILGTAHTTPVTPGATTDYIDGDTLVEDFDNGTILWTYTACAWVRTEVTQDCSCCDEPDIVPILSADCQNVCTGVAVNFTEASEFYSSTDTLCQHVSTTWDYGDGSATEVGRAVSHAFTTPGLYTVTATIDCGGTTETQSILVQVVEVNAEFSVDNLTPEAGEPINITQLSNVNGCTPTYAWDFGDGNTSTVANPGTHTYAADGVYDITLTVNCAQACGGDCQDVFTVQVNVTTIATLTASFTGFETDICIDDGVTTVQFTDTSTSTGVCTIDGWIWEISNDGVNFTQFDTTQNGFYDFGVHGIAGDVTIRLTASCADGGINDVVTQTMQITDITPTFTVDNTTVTAGDNVTLTDTTVQPAGCDNPTITWALSIDGGAFTDIGTTNPLVHTTTVDGAYEYRLTYTCDNGCDETTSTIVTVNAAVALPCVDAVCYIARTADNPDSTRLFSDATSSGAYDPAIIKAAGGQTSAVAGIPGTNVTLTSTGDQDFISPQLNDGGTAAASVRMVMSDGDSEAILNYSFDNAVCGVASVSVNATDLLRLDADVALDHSERSDFPADENFGVTGDNTTSVTVVRQDINGLNATERGLFYFDNLTDLTFTLRDTDLDGNKTNVFIGLYLYDCNTGDEQLIAHCPTANEFYTFDGANWNLDAGITAVGEWAATTCP